MTKQETLDNEFSFQGKMQGKKLTLNHSTALDYLAKCEELGAKILGLDFYHEEEGVIEPMLNSTHFNDITQTESIQAVKDLITEGFPDHASHVSFVVE
jgi:hypothetical protein